MTSAAGPALPLLCEGSGPVARQGDQIISRGTFLAQIEELAAQLPDASHVVNFCSDRYRFTVAWAAAMVRGQTTLLPSARDAGSVVALRADYPSLYVLTDDDDDLSGPRFAYPSLSPSG
ncbi:MAG TPA: hypothetical protein VGF36_03175, partial [Rhodopila sp.]